jgi:multiple sugar transport system substrate-binding protein
MSSMSPVNRRRLLKSGLLVGGLGVLPVAALAGCGETQVIEVIKEVPVDRIKEVVKEVPVEKEKIVEKIVERIVTVVATKAKPEQVVLRHMFFHGQWTKSFEQIHKNFQAKNPHVEVLFEAPAGGGYGRKIGIMLAGGVAPDVFSINWDMVQIFGQRDQLFDLTEVAKTDGQFGTDLDAYHPKIANWMKFKGRQLGVGLDHDNVGVYWNVSLFEEMGVPPLTDIHEDWTWDDAVEIAKKLTKPEDKQYGWYSQNASGQTGYWGFVWSNGVPEIYSDDNTKADPLLDSRSIQALQWIGDMRDVHNVAPSPEVMSGFEATSFANLFPTGKLGMGTDGSWRTNSYVTQIKKFEWDLAHVPRSPSTGDRHVTLHGTGFGVNPIGDNLDAAVELAKHLATRETHAIYGTTGSIQSAREDEWNGFYEANLPPKSRYVLRDAVEYSKDYLVTGQWGIYSWTADDPINEQLSLYFNGRKDLQPAIEDGVAEFNRIMAEQVEATERLLAKKS